MRTPASPESIRASTAIADLEVFVTPADRPLADGMVGFVANAPGAALLVWGSEAICLAYNRGYRTTAGLRVNALGKPLFRAQSELDRPWRVKIEMALAGAASAVDGSVFIMGPEGLTSEQMGWMMPVIGSDGASRGALILFMDASAVVDPMRRMLSAVAHDLREPVVGIQVLAERLARLPKPTRERCVEDMDRVTELTQRMDHTIDDLGAFARRAGAGGGARVSLRPLDLGALVRRTCDKLNAGKGPKVTVRASEVNGLWDEDAIQRIVTSLVTSARQHDAEGASVEVEVAPTREGALLSVRDDGAALRADDAEQLFEPWRRGGAPAAERRRRGVGVGLFLARELVQAHGGRISADRSPQGGFILRVLLPNAGGTGTITSRPMDTRAPLREPGSTPEPPRTQQTLTSMPAVVGQPPRSLEHSAIWTPRSTIPAEPAAPSSTPDPGLEPSSSPSSEIGSKPRSGPRR